MLSASKRDSLISRSADGGEADEGDVGDVDEDLVGEMDVGGGFLDEDTGGGLFGCCDVGRLGGVRGAVFCVMVGRRASFGVSYRCCDGVVSSSLLSDGSGIAECGVCLLVEMVVGIGIGSMAGSLVSMLVGSFDDTASSSKKPPACGESTRSSWTAGLYSMIRVMDCEG